MTSLKISIAQHSFHVGDITHNVELMKQLAEEAKLAGSDLIVFPELALTGYPPEDLLLRPSMALRVNKALAELNKVAGIAMVVGHPHYEGGQCFNAASVILDGKHCGVYHKQCLPNESVFDEARYFTAGTAQFIFAYKGKRIGLLICEDLWQEAPLAQLCKYTPDLTLVLNASPFEIGKQATRKALLERKATQYQLPLVYVNTVGGQDDLVFDGGSLAVNANGDIAFEAERFSPQLGHVVFDTALNQFAAQPAAVNFTPVAETYQALVVGLRDYVNNSGFKGVMLGLSGGIDSALTLAIAVDALGAERVSAVMMPFEYTAAMSVEDASAQAQRLGVHFHVFPIHDIMHGFMHTLAPVFGDMPADATEENLQARIRGTLLMSLSNKFGQMVVTTGNKSEMAVGYATLYGDMVGGYNALKDVYKTQVYQLALFRNSLETLAVIPERVIQRAPSAELRPEQTDQDALPPYDVLDAILQGYIEQDQSLAALVASGFDKTTVSRIIQLVDRSEYKRKQSAPGVRVSSRAFTRERRYPLVNGWKAGE